MNLTGAPILLQVLMRNLVENAITYTPCGGNVRIRLNSIAGGACLSISDSGPGIPEAKRAEAMARFRRLDENGHQGHGLGLSIVARIAEMHGATVRLGSSGELGGLEVETVFPAG